MLSLNGNWRDASGQVFAVPFCSDEHRELEIQTEFFLKEALTDTCFLYIGGISWSAEIYLNDRLIQISENPFQEQLIAIPPQLLNKQWNALRVYMQITGPSARWNSVRLLGIHRPIWLLVRKSGVETRLPMLVQADTTLFYVPWSNRYGYNVGLEEFEVQLQQLKRAGIHAIYLPFGLPNRLLAKMAELGMGYHIRPGKLIALYAAYPGYERYWTQRMLWHENQFSGYEPLSRERGGVQHPELVLYLMLAGLAFLVFWKLYSGRYFGQVFETWQTSKQLQQIVFEGNYLRFPYNIYIIVGKILFQTGFVFFFFLTIKQFGWGENLDIIRTDNYLTGFYNRFSFSELQLGLAVLIVMSFYNSMKYFLQGFIGEIYRQHDFSVRLTTIEALAEFPVNVILFVLTGIIFFISPELEWLILYLLCLVYLIYLVRRIYVLALGLDVVLGLPLIPKILYLCAFEILPWILVF